MDGLEIVELTEPMKLAIVQGLANAIEDTGLYLSLIKSHELMPTAHLIPLMLAYNKFLGEVRNISDAAKS